MHVKSKQIKSVYYEGIFQLCVKEVAKEVKNTFSFVGDLQMMVEVLEQPQSNKLLMFGFAIIFPCEGEGEGEVMPICSGVCLFVDFLVIYSICDSGVSVADLPCYCGTSFHARYLCNYI